ncbi:glycine--tRNA ligase subunit beta [Spartinivicinus poritis]|uniref:Glycine--tRNA ligase beta subunit n=1 Tax=Spartinivicinus poritis TaxID=2994640 RepID=A0ABT5UBK5_9GAMM|nr:glycine--tRNA ligase subunit beta [Spartinivicinus sp. A2-2]MDE1463764.1 glycine--tRNA ligase subunit beta [Spartinivicinus sp. A2-2]
MASQDFLVEIGTEELPPKALKQLATAFAEGITKELNDAQLTFDASQWFATPRRLAVLITGLVDKQPDRTIERKGPGLKAAFDKAGNPTKAAEGFARSCGVTVSELETLEQGKNAWLVYRSVEPGKETIQLLPGAVDKSVNNLPIPKRMRWGNSREDFVRPVQWLTVLFGSHVVPCSLLGVEADRVSYGHRFHHNEPISIESPKSYTRQLNKQGKVIACFKERQQQIKQQVEQQASAINCRAVIDEDLLDEVTALVEWPVALTGKFDKAFLEVPAEALISSMKEHQKYFHVVDNASKLVNYFITVSNIESTHPQTVITGNERVIRPRLADAAFFYETDKKTSLSNRREQLKAIIFQARLGSIYDKTTRISQLAGHIAEQIGGDTSQAKRAGELAKSDLVTDMVLEFPELQGIMGRYYAEHDDENPEVAAALDEQYMPRFSGDQVPTTLTGSAVSIADKVDTLVGIFGIGQPPSGTKDPFALRRAALGVLRIVVTNELSLDIKACIEDSISAYQSAGVMLDSVESLANTVLDFILERFRAWYQDEGLPVEVFMAVKALRPVQPLDFDQRVKAVEHFRQLPEAEALAAANKRVSNILAKQGDTNIPASVDDSLLVEDAEKTLAKQVALMAQEVTPLFEHRQYTLALELLAQLKENVDTFFDQVLVNVDDAAVRQNRYALLQQLRDLFLKVADISLLQTS